MDSKELSQMRLKQVGLLNSSILAAMVIFYTVVNLYSIKVAHFFFVLGVIVLSQGVYGLIKGDSTRSILPFLEKVAIYEKQKMGNEWYKQRKVGYIWILVFSCILFLQSYVIGNTPTENIFVVDLLPFTVIVLFMLITINFVMILNIRKVDRSTSEQDMKGYTWRSNLIAIGLGIILALIITSFSIYYVISGI